MGNYQPTNSPAWPTEPKLGASQNFSQSTAATFEVAAAVAGKKIRLLSAELYVSGAQTLTFKSGTDTILGGTIQVPGAGVVTIGPSEAGHRYIESASGSALNLTTANAVTVAGSIVTEEV